MYLSMVAGNLRSISVYLPTPSQYHRVETQHKLLVLSLMLHQKSEDRNVLLI